MATTVERPQAAYVVAHATEYPTDRDGHGAGADQKNESNRDERRRGGEEAGQPQEAPAVLVDANRVGDRSLDGVAAYKAAALRVLEPGIDHGPVRPLRGPIDRPPPGSIRHAYEDHGDGLEPHEVNVAT